jgi:hypothetical protein
MHRSIRLLTMAAIIALPLADTRSPAHASNWSVGIGVLPNPMHPNEPRARVLAKSHIGAVCQARVTYDGSRQRPIILKPVTIKSKAIVTWYFHSKTTARHGQAGVICTYKHATLTSIAYFKVL